MNRQIAANTFTPLYDAIEDRIRLVINYDDVQNRVDFMITRAFILNLLPSIEEFIQKHYKAQSDDVLEIHSDGQTSSDAISQTNNDNLEFYKIQDRLLQELNLSFDANTQLTTLTFSANDIQAIAQLDINILKEVLKIIKKSVPYIAWGISHHF